MQSPLTNEVARALGIGRIATPLWRRWWSLLLVAIALGGGVWWRTHEPKPVRYVFGKAEVVRLQASVTATGTLQPIDKVTVGAEVSGRVDEILVDFNSHVRKGQVIARLNTDELQARAVQARAGVAQAQANARKAEHDFVRAKDLRARGYVSQEAFDQTQTSRELALAQLHSAQAAADQTEASLAKTAIRSPMDGIVLDRKVERGQTVASAFQTPELFIIASDLTKLQLTVDIDEADIGGVQVDQTATFSVDAYPTRAFVARVKELRNAAHTVANVVTYQGVLIVDNKDGLLKPGMTATADIVVRVVDGALTVPNRALRFAPPDPKLQESSGGFEPPLPTTAPAAPQPGHGKLWQLGANGKTVAREVQLGVTDGKRTEITGNNVRAGEQFILDVMAPPTDAAGGSVEVSAGG